MTMGDAEERGRLLALARAQTIAPKVLEQIEQALRHPKQLLNTIEKQERYITALHLASPECPWCDSAVSYFEAIPAAIEYKLGYGCDDTTCPHCQKRILESVPFIGNWHWRKHEDDKNPERRKPPRA
jgi:hypothetical protein